MQCIIRLQTLGLVALAGTLAVATSAARPVQAEDLLVVGAGLCTTDEGDPVLLAVSARAGESTTTGVACLLFVNDGVSILLDGIRRSQANRRYLYFAKSADVEGGSFNRVANAVLGIPLDAEDEVKLTLGDETMDLHLSPDFGISIEGLPKGGPTEFLGGCADDRGTLLSLAVAHDDEGRTRGFGFVDFEDSPGIPIEFFEVLSSGQGRNEELQLTGEAAIEIRGEVVLTPILVVLDPKNEMGLVSFPDIGVEAAIAIPNLLEARKGANESGA